MSQCRMVQRREQLPDWERLLAAERHIQHLVPGAERTAHVQGVISTWHDRKIMPGDKWAGVIDDNFKRADLILLLVSADFLASDYCYEVEMRTALEGGEGRGEGGAGDPARV